MTSWCPHLNGILVPPASRHVLDVEWELAIEVHTAKKREQDNGKIKAFEKITRRHQWKRMSPYIDTQHSDLTGLYLHKHYIYYTPRKRGERGGGLLERGGHGRG